MNRREFLGRAVHVLASAGAATVAAAGLASACPAPAPAAADGTDLVNPFRPLPSPDVFAGGYERACAIARSWGCDNAGLRPGEDSRAFMAAMREDIRRQFAGAQP